MASWFYSCWMVLLLFRHTAAEPSPRYVIHQNRASFDHALEQCSPGGLTTITTEKELADILARVSGSVPPLNQNEFTFWVGLRKVKNECVVPTLPLRGFKWTEDGSQESALRRWTEEPKQTCTTLRCAALKGEADGSAVTRWGLIPVNCKNSYQFICKLRDTPQRMTSEPPPATPEPHKSAPATQKPEPAASEPPTREPANTELTPTSDPELHGPDPDRGSEPVPAPGSDSCQHPVVSGSRFLTPDPDNSSRMEVECWSAVRLELRCSGRPAVWRLLDDAPANLTTICRPCDDGFRKNTDGTCADVDECDGGAPCRHTCLNTEGSYRCVCADADGKRHDEDSPACKDTATPIFQGNAVWLVAVAAVVVLAALAAVIVKCCLMRRSKKRAMRKAEKMAMRSKDDRDSFEAEKAAS